MTHRAIEDVLSSFCSLQAEQIRPFSTTFNQKEIGKHGIAWFKAGLEKMIAIRDAEPAGRFIDVLYKDVIKDPLGEYRRVMSLMGLTVGPNDEKDAQDWMAGHGRDTHPRHKYTPEENGMTRDELVSAFAFYRERFLG